MTKLDISIYQPCGDAVKYYATKESFEQAWNDCHRGDWMLWIAARLEVDKKLLVLAAVKCARTVQQLMKDERSLMALDVAERWVTGGDISEQELKDAAARAAYAAAHAANVYDAAARAAYATAAHAADPARALDAVIAAASAGINQEQTADICRQVLTEAVMEIVKSKSK